MYVITQNKTTIFQHHLTELLLWRRRMNHSNCFFKPHMKDSSKTRIGVSQQKEMAKDLWYTSVNVNNSTRMRWTCSYGRDMIMINSNSVIQVAICAWGQDTAEFIYTLVKKKQIIETLSLLMKAAIILNMTMMMDFNFYWDWEEVMPWVEFSLCKPIPALLWTMILWLGMFDTCLRPLLLR